MRPRLGNGSKIADYRHDATRKNNPPAGLVEFDRPPAQPTRKYSYNPHLDPQLIVARRERLVKLAQPLERRPLVELEQDVALATRDQHRPADRPAALGDEVPS